MGWSGNWNKKRICLISIAGILVFIICIFGVNLYFSVYGEEWNAIQSIANNIDDYEVEIERWGYQVSIYDPMSGNTSTENDFALINYAEGVYDPVLILTDQAGGRWYFYNGFDQYAQETESIELMPLMDGDEEALRIITQLQLYKTRQDQPPQKENIAQPDTRAYYDVTVKNGGTLNAELDSIVFTDSNNDAILYSYSYISEGDVINAGATQTFTITVEFNNSYTTMPESTNSSVTMNLTYVQG